jgi:ribosome maturation factor RimP
LAASVVERIRRVATRVAASYGLDIFDVQFRREAAGMVVRIQIDRPGPAAAAEESVSVDDCARVSRDLSAVLDVEDVVPGSYTLEVSSPGLDRPLLQLDDYRRFAGRLAKLVVSEAIDGQSFLRGHLAGVDEAGSSPVVMIDGEGGRRHRVPFRLIRRGKLEVEF